ncbi:MAG: ThiF family adenylyltransferase [Proteobacteria bacterium]|nr:ThiF family adenylyltransferase [Pseudomonadota bacterium]
MNEGRYSRQVLFSEIGKEGQDLILKSSVLIVGCGALGTVTADHLARSGVGKLKIVDRDYVELNNLQRQILFDEEDARGRLPKAVAAAAKLRKVNSEIEIEPVVADVNPKNAESLVTSVDLVVDGTDNIETRYLINDACVKNGIPWIYGGVIGSRGMTMDILPGKTACFRCLVKNPPPHGSMPTCDMVGVLNGVPGVIASIQATEALKILIRYPGVGDGLTYVDLWGDRFSRLTMERDAACPTCVQRKFEFLQGATFSEASSLCGRNAVQISPATASEIDMERLKKRLTPLGQIEDNGFFLSFKTEGYELIIFPEGRTLVKGTNDESVARTLFAKYIGS